MGRQFLAYSMSLEADGDLAMVLPIPVPPASREDAVSFIDMSSQKTFFDDLDQLFPAEISRYQSQPQSADLTFGNLLVLEVHDVGDFEASFVPSRKDFERLDPRFRLAPDVWDALPQYADWGFCVFKLRAKEKEKEKENEPKVDAPVAKVADVEPPAKPGILDRVLGVFGLDKSSPPADSSPSSSSPKETREFHPMAFAFPRRDERLFFPTIHVHDGAVHRTAHFDHTLYCQLTPSPDGAMRAPKNDPSLGPGMGWTASKELAGTLSPELHRWVDPTTNAHRLKLIGDHPNRDVFVVEEA